MYFSFILEDSKMRKGGLTLEGYSEETVRLVGYGREDCSDLHSWGPGVRAFYIIHYVIRGAGFLECGGKRFRITAGESFLLYPYTELFYGEGDRAAIVTYRILFLLAGCSCDWCRGYSSFV